MDRLYIKARKGYEQTGVALKYYLDSKKIAHDLVIDDNEFARKKHLYSKVIELGEVDCVNEILFTQKQGQYLDTVYFGDFSLWKLKSIPASAHIYSEGRWPSSNFISIIDYHKLSLLPHTYKNFIYYETDPKWIYMSFAYAGCTPVEGRYIGIKLAEDYAKELSIV